MTPMRMTDSFVTDPTLGLGTGGGAENRQKKRTRRKRGQGRKRREETFLVSPRSESDGERCVWDETASVFPVYLPCV